MRWINERQYDIKALSVITLGEAFSEILRGLGAGLAIFAFIFVLYNIIFGGIYLIHPYGNDYPGDGFIFYWSAVAILFLFIGVYTALDDLINIGRYRLQEIERDAKTK